jgi:hypothetical protein
MKVHIVNIATNIYIEYWENLIDSLEKNNLEHTDVTVHIFTDDPHRAALKANSIRNLDINIYKIPNLVWPEATLNRYEYIHQIATNNQGIVAYLDSDMLITDNLVDIFRNEPIPDSMYLVAHPGYWRPRGIIKVFAYILAPTMLVRDISRVIKMGSLGDWETRESSAAFVPRSARDKYVCGGFWYGSNRAVAELSEKLQLQILADSTQDIIAKWHDESHLNQWASIHKYKLLGPEFCFNEKVMAYGVGAPKVVAVEKHRKTR